MAPEIADLELKIAAFEAAKEKLEGYVHGVIPLPSVNWTKTEFIQLQRTAVNELFDNVIFKAMALERINALPVDLSEKVAQLTI